VTPVADPLAFLSPEALAALGALVDARVEAKLAEREPGPTATAASEFLTVGEAAEYLRCNPQRIYDLTSSRRIPKTKEGTRVLIARADLDRHLDRGRTA
jgi:excisionase family DNA binding protein